MSKLSVWTVEGRMERKMGTITPEKLGKLKVKRLRQLRRLVYKPGCANKVGRLLSRIEAIKGN